MEAISPNKIDLRPGERIYVEPGAMMAYHNCEMQTNLSDGGILDRIRRSVLGGESLIQNQFTGGNRGGWVSLEEHMPGQIVKKTLSPRECPLLIRRCALIASSPNIELDARFLGLSGYFSGKGVSMLRATARDGNGDVHFHTTEGVVHSFRVNSDDGPVYVDNNLILAYSENLKTTVTSAGNNVGSWFFSGEGLVTKFEGNGIVYVGAAQEKYKPAAMRQE